MAGLNRHAGYTIVCRFSGKALKSELLFPDARILHTFSHRNLADWHSIKAVTRMRRAFDRVLSMRVRLTFHNLSSARFFKCIGVPYNFGVIRASNNSKNNNVTILKLCIYWVLNLIYLAVNLLTTSVNCQLLYTLMPKFGTLFDLFHDELVKLPQNTVSSNAACSMVVAYF